MYTSILRIIKRIFDFSLEEESIKLLKVINKSIIDLCQDQYGNYVIQHLLETRKGENCVEIYQEIKGSIFDMSIYKFESNAIERCLQKS